MIEKTPEGPSGVLNEMDEPSVTVDRKGNLREHQTTTFGANQKEKKIIENKY